METGRRRSKQKAPIPPETLAQALLFTFWNTKWRTIVVIFMLIVIVAFAFWKTIPDDVKGDILGFHKEDRKSQEGTSVRDMTNSTKDRESISVRDMTNSTIIQGDNNRVR